MTNRNIIRRGTHDVMIGRDPLAIQYGILNGYHSIQMHQRTIEDNKLALHCNFRSNPTQRVYRKRIIKILKECVRSYTTKLLTKLRR